MEGAVGGEGRRRSPIANTERERRRGGLLWCLLRRLSALTLSGSVGSLAGNSPPRVSLLSNLSCGTTYANRPLDVDEAGLGWNVGVWFLTWTAECHVGGLQIRVCVWNCSLFSNLSRSYQFVEEDLAEGEKTVQSVWSCLVCTLMLLVPVILHPFKETFFRRPKRFRGQLSAYLYSITVCTRKTAASMAFTPFPEFSHLVVMTAASEVKM